MYLIFGRHFILATPLLRARLNLLSDFQLDLIKIL